MVKIFGPKMGEGKYNGREHESIHEGVRRGEGDIVIGEECDEYRSYTLMLFQV